MNEAQAKSAIEAVLFAAGDSVALSDLAAAADIDEPAADLIVRKLRGEYALRGSGLMIIRLEDRWQMCTRPETYAALVTVAVHQKKPTFSDAAMETLSIIAYRQPVTRLEMERIRGVNCAHSVDRLLDLGLIEEAGRLNAPGRPILFKTTEEFLRAFGLSSLEDLPQVDESDLKAWSDEAENEAADGGEPVEVGV